MACVHSGSFAAITSSICLLILILNSSALRTKGPSHERARPMLRLHLYVASLTSHHYQYHLEMVAVLLTLAFTLASSKICSLCSPPSQKWAVKHCPQYSSNCHSFKKKICIWYIHRCKEADVIWYCRHLVH